MTTRLPKWKYREYIRSPEWAEVKARYRSSNRRQHCFACDDVSRPVDLHHRTYARLGYEELDDLIPLCRECHEEAHWLAREASLGVDQSGAYETALYHAATRVRDRRRDKDDRGQGSITKSEPEPSYPPDSRVRGNKKYLRVIMVLSDALAAAHCARCGDKGPPTHTLAPPGKPIWPLCGMCAADIRKGR